MNKHHILVIGSGSVGKRHLRNFSDLGCKVSAMDLRSDRLSEANQITPLAYSFSNIEDALHYASQFSGVVICSPTKYHVEQAELFLEKDLPVFLEKPVSKDAKSAESLLRLVKQSKAPLFLGYTYRWWPPIKELKSRIDSGVIGKILHVQCSMSAHLADWHPWEKYQEFFMSSKELGGGALLDESHIFDLMLWMFGMPNEIFGKVERISNLEIESDDNVDVLFSWQSGLRIYVHLDLYKRPHDRSILVTGEEGTLHWTFIPNRLRFSNSISNEWIDTNYECDRNEMFINAAKDFLRMIDTKSEPLCSIEDAYMVMKLIDAIRQSTETKRAIIME